MNILALKKYPQGKLVYQGKDLDLPFKLYINNISGYLIPTEPGEYMLRFEFEGNNEYYRHSRQIVMFIEEKEIKYYNPIIRTKLAIFTENLAFTTETYYDNDTINVTYGINSDNRKMNYEAILFEKGLTNANIIVTCSKDGNEDINITPEGNVSIGDFKLNLPNEIGSYAITFTYNGRFGYPENSPYDEDKNMYRHYINEATATIYYNVNL